MHIIKRGGVYYFRRRIPQDLVAAHGGQREVLHSLRTKDRPEAMRKALRAAVALDDRWCEMRGVPPMANLGLPPITEPVRGAVRVAPTAEALAPAAQAEGLADMLPIWKRERRPNDKTKHAYTRAVEEFDALHRSPALKAITRTMVVMYRDKLQEAGKSVVTVNGRMAFLRALLGVAKGRGLIAANPAEETTLPAAKRAVEARMPYSAAQADVVMAGTVAYKETHPTRYWLPRLARWTGARLNELHQLRRMDVVERDGIRGISITDHGECMPARTGPDGATIPALPMRLKNAGSRRWVPLHPEVAEFWDWARGRPDGALFPADANKFGVISDALSKWYGRALRGPWRISDERITFHSWRHAFADMCRAAGVPPDVRMALRKLCVNRAELCWPA